MLNKVFMFIYSTNLLSNTIGNTSGTIETHSDLQIIEANKQYELVETDKWKIWHFNKFFISLRHIFYFNLMEVLYNNRSQSVAYSTGQQICTVYHHLIISYLYLNNSYICCIFYTFYSTNCQNDDNPVRSQVVSVSHSL